MADHSGPNLWDALPEECKSMILSRLSNREAARIARVSKEFDEVVKDIRDSVQLLVLPPDLSPTALEGFVASHRNLKSLSFKRCSAKVKRFLPILEAAAGGKLDSKWYHRRSLESVDFKSCAFLTDVDVNALCVLHSRLEDVNLANCSGISDVALTVLSRYQQSRPDSNEPSPVSSATTPSEKWPEVPAEEASSMPVIIRENPVTFWPELSVQPSKVTIGGCIWGARSAGPPQAAVDIGQSSKTMNPSPPSRSYAQAALKAVASPSPMVLPHIDWTSVKIPAYTSNDKYPIPSEAPVAEEPNQGKFTLFSTRKKKGNKGKLALPERQSDDMRLPSSRRMDKVVVEDNGKGRRNCSLDFESSGDRRLATRMSLHIPDSQVSTSETEFRKLAEDPLQFSLLRNGKKALQRSQESTPLPAGLEGLQVGTMMKHGKHKDIAPELLEYQMETPIFCGRGDEDHWKVRGLRSVSLAGCNDITDKGVQALLRGPSKDSLVSLDISRCSSVTSAGLRLPPVSVLENLVAAQLPNISRLFLQLSSEGSLRHLSLAACPKLDDLHLVAPYLQTLNLSNCKKLIRLQLKCPELLSCNLSLCESLELIARFTCGSVQVVNVYGCRSLRPVGFSTILDSSVSLRELRCGGCDRLERLEIPQSSLVRLEAQGCSSLRRLYVQSRLLKSVDACGCKNLTEVYLFSPNLRRMLFTNCTLLQTLVLPLDAMKQSVDLEVKNLDQDLSASREGLEISISGCNVSESVHKNLARLCRHWKSTSAT